MEAFEAIAGRRAIRSFLDQAVPPSLIQELLEVARWSPSGVNMQPWQVAVVTGTTRDRITTALIEAREQGLPEHADYHYYPSDWFEPYRSRRKATGLALYSALNIGREDEEGRKQAWYNNYRFFGAPVGLLFFLDRQLGQGAWIDMGMFIQNLMIAAHARGLGSCPQASLAEYPDPVRAILGVDQRFALLGGLALGWPDPTAAVNSYRTERLAVEEFTHWYD